MTGMQDKILAEVRKIIEDAGLEYVVQPRFANTGNVYAMDGLRAVTGFDYDFQDHYGSLKKLTPSGRGGAGDVGGSFDYANPESIERALNRVRSLIALDPGRPPVTSGKMPVPGYGEISWYRSERDGVLVVEIDTDEATEAAGTADRTGVPQIRVNVNDDPIWEHPPYPEGDIHPWVAPDPQAVAAGEADADACDECGEVEDHWRHHVPDPSLEDDLRTIRKAHDDEGVPLVGEED